MNDKSVPNLPIAFQLKREATITSDQVTKTKKKHLEIFDSFINIHSVSYPINQLRYDIYLLLAHPKILFVK